LFLLAQLRQGSEVIPDWPTQSISAEDTFEQDVTLTETEPMIRRLAEKTWTASRKELRIARTVVLKLKTSEFKILTRSHTPLAPPSSCEELTTIALSLRERIDLSAKQRFRLVGVGLSNFSRSRGCICPTSSFHLAVWPVSDCPLHVRSRRRLWLSLKFLQIS
jgi:DNA polymerase-4